MSKILNFIKNILLLPVNIAILALHIKKLDGYSSSVAKINNDLNTLVQMFGNTALHYDKFTESLKNLSALYVKFDQDSDYVRRQLDEIIYSIKNGPEKPFDTKSFKVELGQAGSQGTISEIRGLSLKGKP